MKRPFSDWAAMGLLTAIYFAAGRLGLSLAFINESASAVWPPAGIALAALLLMGRRVWPAILFGAFLVNFTTSGSVVISFSIAIGNTLEALAGSILVERFANGRHALDRPQNIFKFVALAGMLSTAISATGGVTTLALAGRANWHDYGAIWLTWWLGDTVSILTVAPLLLIWSTKPFTRLDRKRFLESTGLFLMVFLIAQIVFGGWFPSKLKNYPLEFLCIPFLLWTAFRLGRRATATVAFEISIIATWGTLNGFGPFAMKEPNVSLLLLQAFMGTITITGLVLASANSERKKGETEKAALISQIEAQRQRLSNIVATVPGIVWEASGEPDDASQRINFVSDYIETMLGYQVEEWLAPPNFWLTTVHPDDKERAGQEAAAIFASGKGGTSQFRWMAKDGRVVWVEAQSVVICKGGAPIGMRGVTMDITARKEAEERLERKTIEAQQASRAKSQLISNVSHELRTPLNGVIGYTHLLLDGTYGPLTPEQKISLEGVLRNADDLLYLITNLLDLSKIESGKISVEPGLANLSLLIQEILAGLQPMIEKKLLSVRWNVDPALPVIESDASKIKQILVNLLSNAVKFTNEGGVTVRTRDLPSRHGIEVSIKDTGIGIPEEELPRIFDAFHQVDGTFTREFGGTGLGLAIVKELTEMLKGTIQVESQQGEGSTFTLFLPYHFQSRSEPTESH